MTEPLPICEIVLDFLKKMIIWPKEWETVQKTILNAQQKLLCNTLTSRYIAVSKR